MEWRYHIMCYGCPFVVAFVYIFIHTASRGRIYGPATLWCWIDIDWVALRIALCYAPAWIAILTSFCIYVLAGREIFAKRTQLRAFNLRPSEIGPVENPFTDFKTTQVEITHEFVDTSPADLQNENTRREGRLSPTRVSSPYPNFNPYSVSIGSTPVAPRTDLSMAASKGAMQCRASRAALEANAAAWGYTKVALLFFISLLVTWVSWPYSSEQSNQLGVSL